MTTGNFVKEVLIQDVEKRRQPSKHYVYRIKVSWSDGKIHLIYRRYSQFFSLQDSLIYLYPKESGASDPAKRIIPLLPGKILFGRSQIREVALKRKDLINEYLQKLVKLPEHISKSDLVLEFLTVTQDDVGEYSRGNENEKSAIKSADNISEPILLEQYIVVANFEKSDRNQVSLACGDTVDVIEKNDNGWWFVTIEDEHGWAPSSYLEPIDGVREDERGVEMEQVEKFICIKDYTAQQHDELSLKLGDIVMVTMKQRDGWWTVNLQMEASVKAGVVPAAHLKKVLKPCSYSHETDEKDQRPKGKDIAAPPRQNTVKKVKRAKPKRPRPLPGLKKQAIASEGNEEEEVVYMCANDYQEVDSGGTHLNIPKGAELTVLEKAPNGWWKVKAGDQEGWIPSAVAQRKRRLKVVKGTESYQRISKPKELYITISSYVSNDEAGLSFESGQQVDVLDKDPNGWWYVNMDTREGWVPSNYLKKYESKRNSLQGITVEENSTDDYYMNAVLVHKPDNPADSSPPNAKPSVPPKPKPPVLPKPKLIPPKHEPSSASCNQMDELVSKLAAVKQKGAKPGRPDVPTGYDQVTGKPRDVNIYSNICTNTSLDRLESHGEIYVALADHTDDDNTMLSFIAGQLLLVTKKEDNGWWFAEIGEHGGWVPSNYLKEN